MTRLMLRCRRPTAAATISGLALLLATGCGSGADGASKRESSFTPRGDVTMVVPFGAGGGSDAAGRALAKGFEQVDKRLNISVENREGGSGAVGYSYFFSKQRDPEYLLPAETALLALPIDKRIKFDYKTFTPLMMGAEDFTILVVAPDSPYASCADVVNAAKRTRVVAAVSGATSLDNVVFSLVERKTGAKFARVPFESGSEVLAALLGGRIDVASLNPGEVIGQLKANKLKALCAFADKRYTYPELKGIPTAKEQGVDVAYAQFRGLIAPGNIEPAARTYWLHIARAYVRTPAYKQYVAGNFLQPNQAFGDDFVAYLERNSAELARALGK